MPDPTALLDLARGVVAFLVVIPVLVTVHELGHFWAARAFGMKVDAFAVMVGGRRATDLTPMLERPLGPAWPVWALGALGAVLAYAGGGWESVAGVLIGGVAAPAWAALRLERLYHLPAGTAVRTLGVAMAGAAALLLFATGPKAGAASWAGIMAAAALASLLVVYYRPAFAKSEDAPQGHGRVWVKGEEIPVRFRPLWSRRDRHGTEFSLLCLPLGGFAAIRGMHPKEDGAETAIEGGFYSRPPWQRWVVLFAGPLFSIAFGILLLTGAFASFGRFVPDPAPVLGMVKEGGPGAKAGLEPGDRIVEVDGKPVGTFFDLMLATRDRTDAAALREGIVVVYERDGKQARVTVVPEVDAEAKPVLDARLEPTGEVRKQARLLVGPRTARQAVPVGEAFMMAVRQPVDMAVGLASLARKPERVTEDLGGPATIATQTVEASKQGLAGVLVFAALLSVSFGVFNLLPVSPLDGGQMLVATVEMLRGGRRLSFRTQSLVANVSFVLLGMLVLTVLAADIKRHAGPGLERAAPR